MDQLCDLPPSGISIVRDARTVFMVKVMRVACLGAGAVMDN